MRYLLILQRLCAEMHGLADWLARQPGNEIMLALERSNHYPDIPGAERIILKKLDLRDAMGSQAVRLGGFMQRAEKTAQTFKTVAATGRIPDLILVYSANGSGFNPKSSFPDSFVVNYACDLTGLSGNARKASELLELMQDRESDLSFRFGSRQGPETSVVPYILDTDYFRPNEGPRDRRQIVFWLKDRASGDFLEWVGKIAQLAEAGLQCIVFAPGKEEIQAGMPLLGPERERVIMTCSPQRTGRKQLFASGALFVCPSELQNLDLLEAMACAMPVMANRRGCLKIPDGNLAHGIMEALGKPDLLAAAGAKNRAYALANHAEAKAQEHVEEILIAYRKNRESRGKPKPEGNPKKERD